MASSENTMERICQEMPKIELHAHLNGCISEEILSRVPTTPTTHGNNHRFSPSSIPIPKPVDPSEVNEAIGGTVELAECFRTFAKIHNVITTPEILEWVTTQVIQDFSADNVVYLELRTTPKIIHAIPSKDVYMESVLQAILNCKSGGLPIVVKLLVSIDRKLSPDEGLENANVAIEWSKKYPDIVIGMDLSGDPTKGNFESFIPALRKARQEKLKITLHFFEVVNAEEAKQMLDFRPDRVGHAVKSHPQSGGASELWEVLKELRIPVEVCLTSNLVTRTVKSLDDHHLQFLEAESLPFVICTDDSGVFRTTLSKEYIHMVRLLRLSEGRLRQVCRDSVDYIFGTEDDKATVIQVMKKWWDEKEDRSCEV